MLDLEVPCWTADCAFLKNLAMIGAEGFSRVRNKLGKRVSGGEGKQCSSVSKTWNVREDLSFRLVDDVLIVRGKYSGGFELPEILVFGVEGAEEWLKKERKKMSGGGFK